MANTMNRKDYFAAHAPDVIPDWFRHDQPPTTKQPTGWMNLQMEDDKEMAKNWVSDPIYDLPEHLQWFQREHEAYWVEKKKWEIDNQSARFFQWRKYYAEMMVETINS